jgi:hypothetical protein
MLPMVSFFEEMEKIALVGPLIGQAVKYPGMVGWRLHQIEEGKGAHRRMMQNIERGVPAGWAALGMRPRDTRR